MYEKGVCLAECPPTVIGMSDVRFEKWLAAEVADWALLDAPAPWEFELRAADGDAAENC